MDERTSRIENKIEKIEEHLNNIKVTLTSQHSVLQEHIRRTELNEAAINNIHEDFKPIKTHVEFIRGLGKFTVAVFAVSSSIVAVLAFILSKIK